jgi:hypothetical protein
MLSLGAGGTAGATIRRREQPVLAPMATSETPLPEHFGATALAEVPTQGPVPTRSIASDLGVVGRKLGVAGVLGISAEDQALVSRVVAENMPTRTTKRLLTRHAK